MTDREKLDKVIKLRRQVIDGGVLYNIYAGDSPCDIVNSVSNFNELLDHVSAYAVRVPAVKKRIPLTKDDLDARFLTGKTMRVRHDNFVGTIIKWNSSGATIFWANIEEPKPEIVLS